MNYPQKAKASKADQLFHKAFMAHHAGKLQDAEAWYRKALSKAPGDMETLYLLGTVCSQQGKYEEAESYLKKALAIQPDHLEALNNMGLTLKGLQKNEEALSCYRRAVALKPDYADVHCNLGNVFELLGNLDEAEHHLRIALQLNPALPNAYYNLGLVLKRRDHFAEASQCFLRGLELKPDLSVAYDDLGSIYKIWGRLSDALTCFNRAIELLPDSFSAYNNRGTVLEELGRLEEALADYERATELNPSDLTAKWNTAFLYLRQGILDRGWEAHELRMRGGGTDLDRFSFPAWDGSSLEGKTLLVYAEQGLGDEILYASCFPDVIAKAGRCIIECDVRLVPIYARSFPSATIQGALRRDTSWVDACPQVDLQIAEGSLPRFVRPTLENFPAAPAYLLADPQRVAHWRSRIADLGPGLKVGICWRSGLVKGERRKQYSQLTQWENILSVPGVHFINLQYDDCTDELTEATEKFGTRITDFSDLDLKNDIDDTAALISSLDLVISAATAVAEIAGAVGTDVFRLDVYGKPMDALGTRGSPWHTSTRLFGQISLGDWDTTLALAADALAEKTGVGMTAVEFVELPGGVRIAAPASLEEMSTYVLKEQQGWFEPEYDFLLGLAGAYTGMQGLDVGAGVGGYSVPLAKRLVDGGLRAITQNVRETSLLQSSRLQNQLEARMDISLATEGFSLDSEMDKHGLQSLDFVRIAGGVCNLSLLRGGARFFAVNSPLVMFGIKAGQEFDVAVAQEFLGLGYGLYRLVPGLGVLVPTATTDDLDVYSANLFACKGDRATQLEQRGVLACELHTLESLPGIADRHWQNWLSNFPYAAGLVEHWSESQGGQNGWEVYWMALNLAALANERRYSAAERYAYLQTALSVMTTLVQEKASIPRLLTLCRILADFGKRQMAVNLLNQTCELLHAGANPSLDEPCLALASAFEQMPPGENSAQWVVAMVLERRESSRAFSSFFTGQEALAVLEEIRSLGFSSDDVDRRLGLIKQRFAPG